MGGTRLAPCADAKLAPSTMAFHRLRHSSPARKLKNFLFHASGPGPGNRWYHGYRAGQLLDALAHPFSGESLPVGYGRWLDERIVEYPWLLSRLSQGPARLLDAGSILNHWFLVKHPRLQEKELTILTLAPESECHWQAGISYVFGDMRELLFRDSAFDEVVCMSTLEHVGLDNQCFHNSDLPAAPSSPASYLTAVRELSRVLKPGGRCFISVPYGKHVVQEWQQIFDASMVDKLVGQFAPSSHNVTYFRYSDRGWQLSDASSAADARYFVVNSDTPWKNHPAAAEAVACLELQK